MEIKINKKIENYIKEFKGAIIILLQNSNKYILYDLQHKVPFG